MGYLIGSVTTVATTVDLTIVGSADWIHWGGASTQRKASVTLQISDYTVVGTGGTATVYNNDPRTLQWEDGSPTTSGSDPNGVFFNFTGNGFSFTAPASPTRRVLSVYCGMYNSNGLLTAHLSDSSAADFTDAPTASTGAADRNYTLIYAAGASQTITVSWVNQTSSGNVTINGAALAVLSSSLLLCGAG